VIFSYPLAFGAPRYYSTSNSSETVPDSATIMVNKVVYGLSNGGIFNDLERPPNPVFKVTLYFDAEYLING